MIVQELSVTQCTHILSASRLARLACSSESRPYIVPIFYAYANCCVYGFSMPGRKIETMRANPRVALLVDQQSEGLNWQSVVAEGWFEEFPDPILDKDQRTHAWSLLSKHNDWWEHGALKPPMQQLSDHSSHVFFRIHIDEMSGREAVHQANDGSL